MKKNGFGHMRGSTSFACLGDTRCFYSSVVSIEEPYKELLGSMNFGDSAKSLSQRELLQVICRP